MDWIALAHRRMLVALLVAGACSVAGIAHAAETDQGTRLPPSVDELYASPATKEARAQIEADAQRRAASLPSTHADIERSQDAYAGLDRTSAIHEAKLALGEAVDDIAYNPFSAAPGAVRGFLSDYSAQVTLPDGSAGLLVSDIPLAVADSDGHREPVDLAVENVPGGVSPVAPLADVVLGARSRDGLSLSQQGVSLVPLGDDVAGSMQGQSLIYPNQDVDTDLVAKPSAAGFESYDVLRSADSPEVMRFQVRMQPGDELVAVDSGGAAVIRDGHHVADVSRPNSVDADGVSLPTSLSVAGDVLAIAVERSSTTRYPVVVDPIVSDPTLTEHDDWQAQSATQYKNWYSAHYIPSGYLDQGEMSAAAYQGGYGAGEYIGGYAPHTFIQGEEVDWWRQSPGDSKIYSMQWRGALAPAAASALGTLQSCIYVGIRTADWQHWDAPLPPPLCTYSGDYRVTVCTAANCQRGGGTPSNVAFWSLAIGSPTTISEAAQNTFVAYASSITLAISDDQAPTISSGPTAPSPTTGTGQSVSVTAGDTGVGITGIQFASDKLTASQNSAWTQSAAVSPPPPNPACTSTSRTSAVPDCPRTVASSAPLGTLPEGHHTITATAVDAVGNTTTGQSNVVIDRSAPGAVSDQAAWYQASSQTTDVTWAPASDPALADGTPGAGTASYDYRVSRSGGTWSAWTSTPYPGFSLSGSRNGEPLDVDVRAVDGAGNVGPMASTHLVATPPPSTANCSSQSIGAYPSTCTTSDDDTDPMDSSDPPEETQLDPYSPSTDTSGGSVTSPIQRSYVVGVKETLSPGQAGYVPQDKRWTTMRNRPQAYVIGQAHDGWTINSDQASNDVQSGDGTKRDWRRGRVTDKAHPIDPPYGCGWITTSNLHGSSDLDETTTCNSEIYHLHDFSSWTNCPPKTQIPSSSGAHCTHGTMVSLTASAALCANVGLTPQGNTVSQCRSPLGETLPRGACIEWRYVTTDNNWVMAKVRKRRNPAASWVFVPRTSINIPNNEFPNILTHGANGTCPDH
jgi:hypothetical protein